jgi:hypothetical protein
MAGDEQKQEGEMQRPALVVDDEPATCELIQKVLYAAGVDALTLTKKRRGCEFSGRGQVRHFFFRRAHGISSWNGAIPGDAARGI